MKLRKAAVALGLAGLMVMLAGCVPGMEDVPVETQLTLSDPADLPAEKAKAGSDDAYDLGGLDCYYDFATLPEGAALESLKVAKSVTRAAHTFGPTTEDSYENRMELVWYRSQQGNDFMTDVAANGEYQTVAGPDLHYLTRTVQAKSSTDPDKTIDYCKLVYWAQDNRAFMAVVPLTFTDDDITRYCVAQQIAVK